MTTKTDTKKQNGFLCKEHGFTSGIYAGREFAYKNCPQCKITELLNHIEELTRERDEARRMYCVRMAEQTWHITGHRDPEYYAEQNGWNCFGP
jgi:hypothetical protein